MVDDCGNLFLKKIPENKTQLWELILELKRNLLFTEKLLTEPHDDKIRVSKVYQPNFDYFTIKDKVKTNERR